MALKERQCTLKEQAWYVNVRGSVHWKGVYKVWGRHWGCKIFFNLLKLMQWCMVRASALQSVGLEFIPLVKSYQKTLK